MIDLDPLPRGGLDLPGHTALVDWRAMPCCPCEVVRDWLARQPATIGAPHKAHTYSLLAKWYGDFFRAIWRDDAVRRELEVRLHASGAWSPVAALVMG